MSKMNLTEATMLALQGKLVENKASKRPMKVAKKVEALSEQDILKQARKITGKKLNDYHVMREKDTDTNVSLTNGSTYYSVTIDNNEVKDVYKLGEEKEVKTESIDVNVDDNTSVSVDTNMTVVETPDATIIIEEPVETIEEPVEVVEVPVEGDATIIPEEIVEPSEELDVAETPVEDELDVAVAEDEDDEEEFVESVKVTENKKLQEEVDEEAYSIAETIAKEIEEKGIMNFEEVDARIVELSSKTEEEILNSDFKNSVYGCLNFEGINQNFSTGDFFTQTYAEQHPEVLEESKKVEENVDIEISDDGKKVEVTTDDGEEVETIDETPVEEPEIPEEVETEIEEPIEEPLDENKKLEEDIEAAPFRNMIYDSIRDDIDGAVEVAERLARAWSDDDCKWYCETYELVNVLPDCTDERYYKDLWGNIRDKWGQIVEEELEENKEVKEEAGAAALLGGVALGAVADAVVDRVHNVLGSVNEAVKYSSKTFNEALTKFYKKENKEVESVKLTKFSSLNETIKLEAEINYSNKVTESVKLEMKPTSTSKSFVRYSLEEISNKKTESKTNNQSLNMLTYKTNKNVLECRYISKK